MNVISTNSDGQSNGVRRNLMLNAARNSELHKISPRTSFEMTRFC
jgi:hypothetical protein